MLFPKDKDIAKITNKLDLARNRLLRHKSLRTDQTRWNIVLEAIQYAIDHSLVEAQILKDNLGDVRLLFEAISRAMIAPGIYCKDFLEASLGIYKREAAGKYTTNMYEKTCILADRNRQNDYLAFLNAQTGKGYTIQCGLCRQGGNCMAFDGGIKDFQRGPLYLIYFYQGFLSSLLERGEWTTSVLKWAHSQLAIWVKAYFEIHDPAVAFNTKSPSERQSLINQVYQERLKANGPGVAAQAPRPMPTVGPVTSAHTNLRFS